VNNSPINAKPHLSPPGHRWGFVQLRVQKTHPFILKQCPTIDTIPHPGECGELFTGCHRIENHINFEKYLQLQNPQALNSSKGCTSPHLCPGGGSRA